MKSIKGTSSPQSAIFRKLAFGVFLLAILALFIGGQQGAPRNVQSAYSEQKVIGRQAESPTVSEDDNTIEIGGQKVPGGGTLAGLYVCSDQGQIGVIDFNVPEPVFEKKAANSLFENTGGESSLYAGDIGGPSTGTTVPKPTLPIQIANSLEIGNQSIPRGDYDENIDIGGQQNAPRGIANRPTSSSTNTLSYEYY